MRILGKGTIMHCKTEAKAREFGSELAQLVPVRLKGCTLTLLGRVQVSFSRYDLPVPSALQASPQRSVSVDLRR